MHFGIPVSPGTTILSRNVPAKDAMYVIEGHPLFVSIDETDLGGGRWRVARLVDTFHDSDDEDGLDWITVTFADGTPPRTFRPEERIEVHTVEVRIDD
jgi:hypothetical protein